MQQNNLIELIDVKKSYFLTNWVEIKVLKWIDLKIKKWEFISLMWESWSGKSTLLNIIGFLHYLTEWKYIFNKEDVSHLNSDNILSYIRNRKIWFIFQQFHLIPKLTALENVILPSIYLEETKTQKTNKAIDLLNKVWLWEKINSKPWELSGWQQQRVSIARALMNTPEIILADEPTWALDSTTSIEIMQLMKELNKLWKTIIMVTHTPLVARYSDRIILLKDWIVIDCDYKLKE